MAHNTSLHCTCDCLCVHAESGLQCFILISFQSLLTLQVLLAVRLYAMCVCLVLYTVLIVLLPPRPVYCRQLDLRGEPTLHQAPRGGISDELHLLWTGSWALEVRRHW